MTYIDEREDDRIFPEEAARVQHLQTMLSVEAMVGEDGAWRMLMDRAFNDAAGALDKLVRSNFASLDEVRQAQWEARRYEQLAGYINSIAREAAEELDDAEAMARRENIQLIQGEEDYPND